jgi:hypothetical protein
VNTKVDQAQRTKTENIRKKHPRLVREERTLVAMIGQYCGEKHGHAGQLCAECRELQDYARERLGKCPFQEGKTVCSKCPVHCYKPAMREAIKRVMRFSGPKMLFHHPVMALWHLFDRIRKTPLKAASKVGS